MFKFKLSIAFTSIFYASFIHAVNEWSPATTVEEINTGYKGGFILFKTTEAHHNPKSCNNHYYAVRTGDAEVEHILSVLLAAQRSGGKIRVGVNPSKCDKDGRISVSRIRSLP